MSAELFAAGILSTDANEHSPIAFAPDGSRVLWAIMTKRYQGRLLEMRYENGSWSKPTSPSFADTTSDDYSPSFTADGRTLLFGSRRQAPEGYPMGNGNRLWKVQLTADGWDVPVPLDTAVSKSREFGHTISGNGTIYLSTSGNRTSGNILRSPLGPEGYQTPTLLPFNINSVDYEDGPYIAPNEDYLIFESTRPGGIRGSHDLYITFKGPQGWSEPMNMGPTVNTSGMDRFPRVTPDGKFLLFASNINQSAEKPGFDYFWVDAKIIEELRDKQTPGLDAVRGTNIITTLDVGDVDRAADQLDQLLSSGPHLDATLIYSSLLRSQKKYQEAEQLVANIPSSWKNRTAVNIELALTKFGVKKQNEGREILDTLLIPEDQQWPKYNYLSNELFALGEFALSDEYLDNVIAIGPNPVMYYKRACGYAKIGEKQRAYDVLNKAVDLGYNSKQQYLEDPDLAFLRGDKQWQVILSRLE
jgi:hypothetical protein